MSRIGAPEFRGKIRGTIGPRRAADASRLFLTKKLNFIFAAGGALAVQFGAFSVKAETAFFRPAPSPCAAMFKLPDVSGQVRALGDEKGRPILVHFFATWCEPCKAELGSLRQFVDQSADKVGVLAVNVGEVPGRVRRFLEDVPVNFPVVLDEDRAVSKSWAVEGLPTTVVLDKNLTPRLAVTGDLDWTNVDVGAEIDRALAKTPDPPQATCSRETQL
jgi:thiol-disulfide isomerase/thioredoxin